MAHLSERKVCVCVKWISVTSRLSCRVFNPHFGTFGKYSCKFGFRKNWISVTSRHLTYCHGVRSIHQSTLRNIRQIFGQIRLSEKFGLRITFAFGHTLFFIASIKFENFIIFWLRHVFTITLSPSDTRNIFQNILLSAQWIVIPAKMIVACSLEWRWIAEGTKHRHERLALKNVDSHWPVCVDWTGGAFVKAQSFRLCQMNKCHSTIIMSCIQSTLRNIR